MIKTSNNVSKQNIAVNIKLKNVHKSEFKEGQYEFKNYQFNFASSAGVHKWSKY